VNRTGHLLDDAEVRVCCHREGFRAVVVREGRVERAGGDVSGVRGGGSALVRAHVNADVVGSGVVQVQPVPDAETTDTPVGSVLGVSVTVNGPTAVSPALFLTVRVQPSIVLCPATSVPPAFFTIERSAVPMNAFALAAALV